MRGEATLPEEWAGREEIELGSMLADIETGWSPACDSQQPSADEWGVIRVSAVTSGRFNPSEAKRLPAGLDPRPELEIRPGDVLVARANGARSLVGVACYVESSRPKLMLSDKTLRLVPDEPVASSSFIAVLLSSQLVRRQIISLLNGSSGQNNISQEDVRRLIVPRVPVAEQRAIVAAHAAVERRIESLERVRQKLSSLRFSLSRDLLAGPLVKLGELLSEKPKNGFSPVEEPGWTGLLTLGLGCLTVEGFQPRQLKQVPASSAADRFRLADGDLLMSRANTRELVGLVGRYQDVGHPCIYPDLMMRLRLDSRKCVSEYMELALQSAPVRKDIQAGARGTSESMVKISAELVESLRVPMPTLREQKRVKATIAALDDKIVGLQARMAKLRLLQGGLMEDLLSDRVRVV